MGRPPRVVSADYLGGHCLRLTFSDGLVRELDFTDTLRGGAFTFLQDETSFADVSVDPVAGTVRWPNGVDLDPDVLHGDFEPASGRAPRVLRERRVRAIG